MNWLFLVAANGATVVGAHALSRQLTVGSTSSRVVTFLLVRLLIISAVVLVAGMASILRPWILGPLAVLSFGVLLVARGHRPITLPPLPKLGWAIWALGGAVLLRTLWQVWIFAPFQPDPLIYHLPKIGEWIQHGGFTRELGLDLRSSFPCGFELIETWWVVFLHHDVLIEMAGVEFLILGCAGMVALAESLGISPKGRALAGLLFVLTPGITLQGTSCLNDAAVASLWVATFALIRGGTPRELWLLPVGLGVGAKATYAYALSGLLVYILVTREGQWTRAPLGWILSGFSVLVGSFWLIRNAWLFGNPIYPMGPGGLSVNPGWVAQQVRPTLGSLEENLRRLFDRRVYDDNGEWGPRLAGLSGWGPASFCIGFPALFLGLRTRQPLRRVAIPFLVSLVVVLAMVVSDPWCMRYILFFPALFALFIAEYLERHPRALALAWACLLVQFVGTTISAEYPIDSIASMRSTTWRERTFFPVPELRDTEAVGVLSTPSAELKVYLLYRPDFSRRVVYLRESSCDGVLRAMLQAGLRFLWTPPGDPRAEEGVRRGTLVRVSANVYRFP